MIEGKKEGERVGVVEGNEVGAFVAMVGAFVGNSVGEWVKVQSEFK